MKKYLFIFLAIFYVFSCKVSLNDARTSLAANIRDDDEEPVEEDIPDLSLDDAYLTSYAKERRAIMFVGDSEFSLTMRPTSGQTTYFYYSLNYDTDTNGKFYFSNNAQDWTDLYEYYQITEVDRNPVIGNSLMFISSAYNEDLKKYVIYFKGEGDNKAFKLNFVNLSGNSVGCYGNIIDLLASDTTINKEDYELGTNAFAASFLDFITLTHAPELPSKTLSKGCYYLMFCASGLTHAPELPALQLAESCYNAMFDRCKKLETPPVLPATIMQSKCYTNMFSKSGIKSLPELPALQLADYCYHYMFQDCKNIGEVDPDLLKATSLPFHCYNHMFERASIKTPLNIRASKLENGCMFNMFIGCTNLLYIQVPTRTDNTNYSFMDITKYIGSMFTDIGHIVGITEDKIDLTYSDFALNNISAYRVSGLPDNYASFITFDSSARAGNPFYFSKEVKGYSKKMVFPSSTDTTTFSSANNFSISSPKGKTWDGSLYYWDGAEYVEWDGKNTIQAVKDHASDNYIVYMVGSNNSVISNGNAWKITGSDVALNLKLGALLDKDGEFIERNGKKYRRINLGEHCFDSWLCGQGLTYIKIENDPCSVVVPSKMSFYKAFENCQDLSDPCFNLNLNVSKDEYLDDILQEATATRDLSKTFSRMFYNCTKLTITSISAYVPNSASDTFADIFESTDNTDPDPSDDPTPTPADDPTPDPDPATDDPAPTPATDDPAPSPVTDDPSEVKAATGSGKAFTPASGSPKDHAKSGVKKPFPSGYPQEGVIRL